MKKLITTILLFAALSANSQVEFMDKPVYLGGLNGTYVVITYQVGNNKLVRRYDGNLILTKADSAKYATYWQFKKTIDSLALLFYTKAQSDARYLQSFTESDPLVASHIKAISTTNISNWNTAFGWGNHASAGYQLSSNLSTNTSLGTSNTLYPSQNAVKTYVDAAVTAGGGYTDEAAQDAIGAMVSNEFSYSDVTPLLSINSINWSKIGSTPTTISGYGITNFNSLGDARWLQIGNNLSDLTNAATARTNLGLVIGTNVQAYNASLAAIAGLSPSNDDIIQRKAGAWVNRTIAQLKTDLNLSGTNTGDQDLSPYATKTGSETLTNKTINGSSNTITNAITLTTTGSGDPTYNGTTLNIPSAGSGLAPTHFYGQGTSGDPFKTIFHWSGDSTLTLSSSGTFTNKTIDGDNNTIQDVAFSSLKSGTIVEHMVIAVSDETTDLTTGTAKVTFRMPYAATITGVRASLVTASSSGNPTIDINESGTTILSTKLTIDASEKTSVTAATAAVISDSSIADDAEITIDIDVAGTGAKGLKITIYYTR